MNTFIQRPSPFKTILVSWLVAGTLDICAAFFNAIVIHQKEITVQRILQGIANSVFKVFKITSAESGWTTALYGLGFHYIIAFCFAAGYYIVYPYIPFLRQQKIIAGIAYGLFAWAVMNLLVLQGFFPKYNPWKNAWESALILVLCIGLPISLIINYFYSKAAK